METKAIKLFVDAHSFDTGFQGIQTFIRNLYTSLLNTYPNLDIYWGVQNAENIREIFPSVKRHNILIYKKRKAGILRFAFDIPYYIKKHQFDFAHFQYLAPLKKSSCRYIVTTHDVLFNDFPAYFSFNYRTSRNFLFGLSIKNAAIKTTVSGYSRERVSKHYNIPAEQIKIIANGVTKPRLTKETARRLIKAKFGITDFILYVSRIEPRKNHAVLLEKYIKLQLYKNIPLVFIGKESIQVKRLQNAVQNLTSEERSMFHWFPQVEHQYLEAFYLACKLFVYPSKAEGFGIPPLEAAICEVPVLCSSATAMSEFNFFEPYTFDPNNETELELKLSSILTDPPSEDFLKNVAGIVADTYQWQQSAQLFYELLTSSLKYKPGFIQQQPVNIPADQVNSLLQFKEQIISR